MSFLQNTWDLLIRLATAAVSLAWRGDAGAALTALVGLMALDYAAALIAAALGRSSKSTHGRLDSRAGFRGIGRKVLIFAAVAASALTDRLLGNPQPLLRSAVTVFYGVNEALSLLENLALCGVPVPPKLRKALEAVRDERDATREEADAPKG